MHQNKILIFSDLHLNERRTLTGGNRRNSAGIRRALAEDMERLRWIEHMIRTEEPSTVLFGGDWYHNCKPTPAEHAYTISFWRGITAAYPEVSFVFVEGNHDQGLGQDTTATEALRRAMHGASNFTYIEAFGVVETPAALVCCQAYPKLDRSGADREELHRTINAELERQINAMLLDAEARQDAAPIIYLGHITFTGSVYDSGQVAPAGEISAAPALLDPFDAAFVGHIHKPQMIGSQEHTMYIGAPNRCSFSDEFNGVGVIVATFDETNHATIRREDDPTSARFFKTFTLLDVEAWSQGPLEEIQQLFLGTHVRVVGETSDRELLDHARKMLAELAELGHYTRNDSRLTTSAEELPALEDAEDARQVFAAWCETRPEDAGSNPSAVWQHVDHALRNS